jgi:hypothetical protein
MFITRENYKSPFSALLTGKGEAGWTATELALQRIWFLVDIEDLGYGGQEAVATRRTLLLFDFKSVEELMGSSTRKGHRLKSVHIATPGYLNGSDNWRMDQLRAVWQGREHIEGEELLMDIFETVSGERYPAMFGPLSSEELATDNLKFQLPH